MRRLRAILEFSHTVLQRMDLQFQRVKRGGIGSLTGFVRRCPFVEFSEESGLDTFDLVAELLNFRLELPAQMADLTADLTDLTADLPELFAYLSAELSELVAELSYLVADLPDLSADLPKLFAYLSEQAFNPLLISVSKTHRFLAPRS